MMWIRSLKLAIDLACATIALFASYALIFSFSTANWFPLAARLAGESLPIFLMFIALAVLLTKLHRKSWRFTSLHDALVIIRANLLALAAFLAWNFAVNRGLNLPRSMVITLPSLSILAMTAARVCIRIYRDPSALFSLIGFGNGQRESGNTLLIGTPDAIDNYLREPRATDGDALVPAAGLVASTSWRSSEIRGLPILGAASELFVILDSLSRRSRALTNVVVLDEGLLRDGTLPSDALIGARSRNVRLLRLPRLSELGTSHWNAPRDVSFEELLQRPSVTLDVAPVAAMLRDARVLVTGAGGSIGSELCRQIASVGCERLICVDHAEFNLYSIDEELSRNPSGTQHVARLCDIRDRDHLRSIMKVERPHIVFHAAALKHVPLMEENPVSAVATNILGTANVREASDDFGCQTLVLVSTDKSVAPSSVMGATKRVAESVVRCRRGAATGTKPVVVRFGNVLGSAGSVIPLFRAQIERGGPVTITHPEVERYFMTIPEAVLLILQAATLGREAATDGFIYVLEMGEPVKIVDLARQVAQAYHLNLGSDIPVEFTGLRPGEKITEKLVDDREVVTSSGRDGIRRVDSPLIDEHTLSAQLDALRVAVIEHDRDLAREVLQNTLDLVRSVKDSRPARLRSVG